MKEATRKTATISRLDSVRISDPTYRKETACRYEADVAADDVQLEYIAFRDDFCGIPFTEFSLITQPGNSRAPNPPSPVRMMRDGVGQQVGKGHGPVGCHLTSWPLSPQGSSSWWSSRS